PSPITTVPSIERLFSACRIASTAAWSAAFSSPRPISREADNAAASVTRTASSARLRSILSLLATVSSLIGATSQLEPRRHEGHEDYIISTSDRVGSDGGYPKVLLRVLRAFVVIS